MTRFAAPIAESIWDMKYRFKNALGEPIDQTVEDTWSRIARALAAAEERYELDPVEGDILEPRNYGAEFYEALEDFKFTPGGRIVAGAGTERKVTMFNCFVMGTIPDSMSGIFDALKEAALTMQQGGGIGYDFSTIRPSTSLVKKLGADSSGPLSFMDVWDAMCRTVMSAGSRRGAMMATMRCDHPDIFAYIAAKKDPARLRMFNLSVLATDDFMAAVQYDEEWDLVHAEPPKVRTKHDKIGLKDGGKVFRHATVRACDLWDAIMEATYAQAEPGVIFIDRINRLNNLNYCEDISSTNPCGEQPLPPYGACLLGSINLSRLVENAFTQNAGIDQYALKKLVAIAVRMLDNVIDVSGFPLPEQEKEARNKRRIGLGVTGLADALAMCELKYGSPAAVARTRQWMRMIDEYAYMASIELAREKGAFPMFDADKYLAPGTHASTQKMSIQDNIREHGIRNALLTSIAPTGTISLYAGNVSSGIEPIFAYSYTRKVLQPDGTRNEELVEDYAVAMYRKYWNEELDWGSDFDNGRAATAPEFDPDKDLPAYFTSAQTLTPADHLAMQAAAQEHVDSSISKTINCPEDIAFEDFKDIYMTAYMAGCKGVTTYRPNEITGSILTVEKKPAPARTWEERGCPDGVACHHDCTEQCDRVRTCGPLTGTYPGDSWPEGILREHGASEHAPQPILPTDQGGKETTVVSSDSATVIGNLLVVNSDGQDVLRGSLTEMSMDQHEDGRIDATFTVGGHDFNMGTMIASPELYQLDTLKAIMEEAPAWDGTMLLPASDVTLEDVLPDRPDELEGVTYKIKLGDQKAVYLTVNDTVESDGTIRAFEVFMRSSDPTHDEWMVALSRMISAVLRRPYDALFVPRQLRRIHSATTGGFLRGGGGRQPSLVAAIGAKLQEHMEGRAMIVTETDAEVKFRSSRVERGVISDGFFKNPIPSKGPDMAGDKPCAECSSYNTKFESGCLTCLDCGHSKCG